MSGMTCSDVETQIDLYAAGECDPPEAAAIERHLARCRACAQALEEARGLVGMLDARFRQEDQLRRLHARLTAEDIRPARILRFAPMVRRVTGLAAAVLLTFGLFALLPSPVAEPVLSRQVALVQMPAKFGPPELAPTRSPPLPMDVVPVSAVKSLLEGPFAKKAVVSVLLPRGLTPEQLRSELLAAEGTDRLRPAVGVFVNMEIRNTSHKSLAMWIGGPPVELTLEVQGPGVLTVRAPEEPKRPAEPPRLVMLAPGESHLLPIPALADEREGVHRRHYVTEPGEYVLTARYTTAVTPAPRGSRRVRVPGQPGQEFGLVTFTSEPVRLTAQAASSGR